MGIITKSSNILSVCGGIAVHDNSQFIWLQSQCLRPDNELAVIYITLIFFMNRNEGGHPVVGICEPILHKISFQFPVFFNEELKTIFSVIVQIFAIDGL